MFGGHVFVWICPNQNWSWGYMFKICISGATVYYFEFDMVQADILVRGLEQS